MTDLDTNGFITVRFNGHGQMATSHRGNEQKGKYIVIPPAQLGAALVCPG
jgi:hypothetical protein